MGSNPISRTKTKKVPIPGAFFFLFRPHQRIKLTININYKTNNGGKMTKTAHIIAHELHTPTKTAHETAHEFSICTHFKMGERD